MKPELINLLEGDCNTFMHQLPDKMFSLGIVDPVYGIDGNSHRRNFNRGKIVNGKGSGKYVRAQNYPTNIWDQKPPDAEYFDQLFRLTSNQIIWGVNYFQDIHPKLKINYPNGANPRPDTINEFIAANPRGLIIWDKLNRGTKFNDYEIAWTSYDIATEVFPFMWSGMMQGLSFLNGTRMNPNKKQQEKRIHPTQKPVELYKYLLHRFAKPGNSILDTFLGGGSIAIACLEYGCPLMAFEIEEIYYKKAVKRFKTYCSQLKLILQ